ncbi:MAG: hypothetical protein Q7S30_01795, partial [Candidatus Omnitrophota bacterium]|nr:hypothetical protein [Candidatus Omnitrophota bacterium]
MKTIRTMSMYVLFTAIIMMGTSFMFVGLSYSDMKDKSDVLSNDQAGIFSPGYINAVKQRADSVINQQSKPKSLMENAIDYVKSKLSDKVKEEARYNPSPELKKKTSSRGENAQSTVKTAEVVSAPVKGDIKIGSGESQVLENGRVISEVIDGKRYVYAGFDKVGKESIQDAIEAANNGDTVIVKMGEFTGSLWGTISGKDGVNLQGGYDEKGHRDMYGTQTVINDATIGLTGTVEISGFTIKGESYWAGIGVGSYSNVTIKNVTFVGDSSLSVQGSRLIVQNGVLTTPNTMLANVISQNNNYLGSWGIGSYDNVNVVSTNDYFALGQDMMVESDRAILSVADTVYAPNLVTAEKPAFVNTALSNDSSSNNLLNFTQQMEIMNKEIINRAFSEQSGSNTFMDSGKAASNALKGLQSNKNLISQSSTAPINQAMLVRLVRDALSESALSIPMGDVGPQEMQLAMLLTNALKNPTEDQKQVLDAVTTLLKEVNKQQQESDSSELKKAADDLLQMTAAVLIAQAIPDLLKEGDVANIKGVFSELNVTKNKIMLDYQKSTKPYYDEVIKELSKNMSILQVKNIISNNMTDEELAKLPRNEIDKIFEKLKQAKDKSFETEYLLQQESKYRKAYIDPNKKLLEEKMKAMMKEFTGRLSRSLEET